MPSLYGYPTGDPAGSVWAGVPTRAPTAPCALSGFSKIRGMAPHEPQARRAASGSILPRGVWECEGAPPGYLRIELWAAAGRMLACVELAQDMATDATERAMSAWLELHDPARPALTLLP